MDRKRRIVAKKRRRANVARQTFAPVDLVKIMNKNGGRLPSAEKPHGEF